MTSIAYHQRLRIARVTLVLAIFAALLAWVLPFDVGAKGYFGGYVTSQVEFTRHTTILLKVTSYTMLELLQLADCTGFIGMRVAYYVTVGLLCLILLAGPFCVGWIPRANLMRWLWIAVDLGVIAALIYGWSRSEWYFITGFTSGPPPTAIHLRFLPGFYLACLAAFLHFTGLLLIPSAKSLDQTTPPA
jgi:hypothetical protein